MIAVSASFSSKHKRRAWLNGCAFTTLFYLSACASTPVDIAEIVDEPPPPPPAYAESLTDDQIAFLSDATALRRFGLTPAKLDVILSAKDAEGVSSTVSAMMETLEAAKYQGADETYPEGQSPLDPVGDMPEVLLNPEAAGYNSRTVLRPAILDEYEREPGPFSLKRYMFESKGIPTFAGAPVAIRKEDLIAGQVEVAFVGVPQGLSNGGWRDAQNAPATLRAMYGVGGYDVHGGVDPALELILADYGNVAVDRMSVELSNDHIRETIVDMLDAGAAPFIVGGDHSVMFPSVAAVTDVYGSGNVTVVHMDAHSNTKRNLAHFYSDEQSVSRLIEEGILPGDDLIQVGIRDADLTPETIDWLNEQEVSVFTMADVAALGWNSVVEATVDEAKSSDENVYISFNMSVLDPSYGLAAGRPAADGLTIREASTMLRRLCSETNVVGMELLDVAPYLDLSYASSLNGNHIMHACLTGIAMRKKGVMTE